MLQKEVLPSITGIRVPERFQTESAADGLHVRHFIAPSSDEDIVSIEPFRSRGPSCRRVVATTAAGQRIVVEFGVFGDDYENDIAAVIRGWQPAVDSGILIPGSGRFRKHAEDLAASEQRGRAHASWADGIQYRIEIADGDRLVRPGLRLPQLGALHAIAAHWTLSEEPALIVMPTGTGKTEVMIAASVASQCDRLLVIVPTDPLRQQTADKFKAYGILRQLGIIGGIPNPVVGSLASKPREAHFDALQICNVVVTTMSSISLADEAMQARFAGLFSHIFFDEAHHIEAASWKKFQQHAKSSRIVLFTATPFREDGKPLPGRMIYNFPLSAAQEQGFFERIHFLEVFEPDSDRADRMIAKAAVDRLREDIGRGHRHILMARAATIDAAEELFETIYRPAYADLNPVVIHSRTPQRRAVLERIKAGEHKIVVCVNMFGEGFDLPQLKIAALHAIHKSLGITLQFIGRFARTAQDVGHASFVANTAEDGVPEALERLFHEDADWNDLLADLSYDAIDPQARLSELVENLESAGPAEEEIEISTLALRPKLSAQVYRTAEFFPERFADAFRAGQRVHQPQISRHDNFLVLVVNQREGIDWTDSRDIAIDTWDLYIAHFDPDQNLLYIHSSRKGDATGKLARTISTDPVLIREQEVFKTFAGLRRLVLHSVGLSSRSRNVRYQMFAGLDVRNAIDPVQQQSKMKSNVTGVGYEEGKRRSVGCSRKGKIWSMSSGSLADWRSWCDHIGAKLSDPDTPPDDFLKYTLIPAAITELPAAMALMVDWPDQLFESANFRFEVIAPAGSYDFHDSELRLIEWGAADRFTFALAAGEELEIVLSLRIEPEAEGGTGYVVERLSGPNAEIDAFGRRATIAEFFNENPPLVRLEDGSQLAGNILLKPQEELTDTYDRNRIQTLDWGGVDITQESRWKAGKLRAGSIQQRFIAHLEQGPATFIIDDDDNGESADIVAIEETDDTIIVNLWHCKYSSGADAGSRAGDLYVVCGQAEKSVKWTWSLRTLINHLIKRETQHARGRPTRFLRGSLNELVTLRKGSRRKFVTYRVGIVQPGLRKEGMPADHLAILGAANSFIQIITDNPLSVVASP